MTISPFVPLLFLLLGVGALAVSLRWRLVYAGPTATVAGSAALVAHWLLAAQLPVSATLLAWEPDSLLPIQPMLVVDQVGWLFGAGVLVLTVAASLTGLSRSGGQRRVARGAALLLALVSLVSIFSANLLTRILAWALLDIVYFLVLILLARGTPGLEPQAVLNLSFNTIGTLLAMAAALFISRESPALSLRDAAVSPISSILVTLAAIFRLGLFPLHLGLPTEITIQQGVGTVLRLIPALVALEVIARLALVGIAEPLAPWLTAFGLLAIFIGALQFWRSEEPRFGLTYIVIAQSALALLAALWSEVSAGQAAAAQALALTAGAGMIYLANGHDERRPWLTILPACGAYVLIAGPLTVGFAGTSNLVAGLAAQGVWGWVTLAALALAQMILAAGLWRAVFWPGEFPESGRGPVAAYLSGQGILLILAVGFALVEAGPTTGLSAFGGDLGAPVWVAGAATLVIAAAGYALWRFGLLDRARVDAATGWVTSLVRLDWLYRLTWRIIHAASELVYAIAGVVEGEGAILWALVAGLVVWLVFR